MKPITRILATAGLLAGAACLCPCCTTITGETSTSVKATPGVPGGKVTTTNRITATVTGIDAARRRVTLVTPAGEKFTVTAGPEVVNFPQIRVGDQLLVTTAEEVEIRMAKPGEQALDTSSAAAKLAPVGTKPSAKVGQSAQVVGTVSSIDLKRRKVALSFSDGSSETFKVRDDIDLTRHRVGEQVVMRVTEVFAIEMRKP